MLKAVKAEATRLCTPSRTFRELFGDAFVRGDLISHCSGYHTPVFAGKQEQRLKVEANVLSKGFIPKDFVGSEVSWFYDSLGIEVCYLLNETKRITETFASEGVILRKRIGGSNYRSHYRPLRSKNVGVY